MNYSSWRQNALSQLHSTRQNFYALPQAHWQRLAEPPFNVLEHLENVEHAIETNSMIAHRVLSTGLTAFGFPYDLLLRTGSPSRASSSSTNDSTNPFEASPIHWRGTASPQDISKADTMLKQLFRDWSREGKLERDAQYAPVLSSLNTYVPIPSSEDQRRVLIPGSGLGRLVLDTACQGYEAEGCEFSYHALLTSSLILNHTTRTNEYSLYPWVRSFSNNISRKSQMQKVTVPDVWPAEELRRARSQGRLGSMSMNAGDFCEVYMREEYKNTFDAALTVFFIDTAPNIFRYIEAIRNCLKPNGVWINLGPLLWHFECGPPKPSKPGNAGRGIAEGGSVELTDEEILELIKQSGFDIAEHKVRDGPDEMVGYLQDPASMLQRVYKNSHWVARKSKT